MTTWQKRSVMFLVITLVVNALLYAAYDIAARVYGGTEGTVSYVVWAASMAFPIIPFIAGLMVGLLAGHFWWRISDVPKPTVNTGRHARRHGPIE